MFVQVSPTGRFDRRARAVSGPLLLPDSDHTGRVVPRGLPPGTDVPYRVVLADPVAHRPDGDARTRPFPDGTGDVRRPRAARPPGRAAAGVAENGGRGRPAVGTASPGPDGCRARRWLSVGQSCGFVPRGRTSHVTLSPCCWVQNTRQPWANGVGTFAPRMPPTPGSPSETWMPVISLSPSL